MPNITMQRNNIVRLYFHCKHARQKCEAGYLKSAIVFTGIYNKAFMCRTSLGRSHVNTNELLILLKKDRRWIREQSQKGKLRWKRTRNMRWLWPFDRNLIGSSLSQDHALLTTVWWKTENPSTHTTGITETTSRTDGRHENNVWGAI